MKKIYFLMAITTLALCSCNQQKNPSAADIERMVNERVDARMSEQESETNTAIEQETEEIDINKKVYDKGYNDGLKTPYEYEMIVDDNEKMLKNFYKMWCNGYDLPKEIISNKELYKQYREGFLKGHKERNEL